LYGYISVGGYITTEAEKTNAGVVVEAFARPLLISYTNLFSSYAKTFSGSGKNWKLGLPHLKIILWSEE
jgi:hypothetical protein